MERKVSWGSVVVAGSPPNPSQCRTTLGLSWGGEPPTVRPSAVTGEVGRRGCHLVSVNILGAQLLTRLESARQSRAPCRPDPRAALRWRPVFHMSLPGAGGALTVPPPSRIRKGFPCEARVVARILPQFLDDFFPPQDVMNKVIGEFLSNQQPYPQFMATVVYKVGVATAGTHLGQAGPGPSHHLKGHLWLCQWACFLSLAPCVSVSPGSPHPDTQAPLLRFSRPCTAQGSRPWSGTGSCCPSPTSRRGARLRWPCGASPASSSVRLPARGSRRCILPRTVGQAGGRSGPR